MYHMWKSVTDEKVRGLLEVIRVKARNKVTEEIIPVDGSSHEKGVEESRHLGRRANKYTCNGLPIPDENGVLQC